MRVKRGTVSRRRHNKVMKLAKGFRGRRKNCYKLAADAVDRSLSYQFRDRRVKKRQFRRLWITRIGAAARQNDLSYSKLIHGMSKAGLEVDRKILADLAVSDPQAFTAVAEQAKAALAA